MNKRCRLKNYGNGSSLGSNPDISQKYKMGDISNGVANTFEAAKKIYKKIIVLESFCSVGI
jgi:hypothetical protein